MTKKTASYPYLAWALLFIAIPLGLIIYFSFTDGAGPFTLENIIRTGRYFNVFIKSIWLSVISTAICLGGPGAVFWMWVAAFFGMATIFAEAVLAQNAEIHVVSDVEGDSEPLFHGALDVIIPPGQVGGEQDHALALVNDAGGAGGDGIELFPVNAGLFDHVLHHADDDLFHIRRAVTLALGAFFQPVDDLVLFIEDGAEDLGPTDVQTDIVAFGHMCVSSCINC